jgi:hypothetical protein
LPQLPFLTFDEEQALAGEHEEVFLCLLGVVEPVRLAGEQHGDPNPELGELGVARLEHATRAEDVVIEPRRVAHVHDEPSLGSRGQA